MNQAELDAREIIMQAIGDCVAEGVFPPEPLPWFCVREENDRVSTDAAFICAGAFGIDAADAAKALAERIYLDGSGFCGSNVSETAIELLKS